MMFPRKILSLPLLLLGVLLPLQSGRAQTVPADGQKYPAGTAFTGPCKERPPVPEKVTRYQGEEIFTEFYEDQGRNGVSFTEGLVDGHDDTLRGDVRPRYLGGGVEKCAPYSSGAAGPIILNAPGQYWMVNFRVRYDLVVEEGSGIPERDERPAEVIKRVKFFIGPAKICGGDENRITNVFVEDNNGVISSMGEEERAGLGLSGDQTTDNQTISVPVNFRGKTVMIEFGSGRSTSRVKMERGSRINLRCAAGGDGPEDNRQLRRRLLMGKVWFYVKSVFGDSTPGFEVETERAVCGVRGTVFSMSHDSAKDETTLYVQEGLVEFRNKAQAASRLMVKPGQTAVVRGSDAPKLIP